MTSLGSKFLRKKAARNANCYKDLLSTFIEKRIVLYRADSCTHTHTQFITPGGKAERAI
jgi:hypothetical protein